jgi:3-mercaptopyruvate sulfurtransferase SseA
MNQRLVYIVGGVVAAALVAFAIWHARQPQSTASLPAPISPTTTTTTADETVNVARIDPEELLAHFKAGDVTIIDVRDADSFLASHIPGSLHIPLARVQGEVSYLPKAKPIVAYCT